MRILHCCLSAFYIDKAQYQENILPIINQDDGHEVQIIASTEIFVDGNTLGLTSDKEYLTEEGIRIVRLPYKKVINSLVSKKFRAYVGLYEHIEEFNPDVVFFHGAAAWALNTVTKYKRKHPHVKLYVDSHEDSNNSARNFLSRNLLYNLFYTPILKRNMADIDKLFYITKETKNFINKVYHIDDEKLEFLPLGGILPTDEVYQQTRLTVRKRLNLEENDILCLHSGKLDLLKRSVEIVKAFNRCTSKRFRMIIAGEIAKELESELTALIASDSRMEFVGWQDSGELQKYMMAADLYIQLGSQSVSMQQALCNRAVAAIYPFESHTYLLGDNVFYISSEEDLYQLLLELESNPVGLLNKRKQSIKFANAILDYRKIAKRIYQ